MTTKTFDPARHTRSLAITALMVLFFLLDAGLNYPGVYLVDSKDQLAQAVTGILNDGHPPMMSVWWAYLIKWSGTPSSLYLFQLSLYWLALGFIADGLARAGRLPSALLVLAAGLFPLFHYVNAQLTKDSQMSAAFLAAFAIPFWFLVQGRKLPIAAALAASLLACYGVLVRANSIFAIGPLLIYLFSRQQPVRYVRLAIVSLALAVLALGVSAVVNHSVIGAKKTAPVRSLQIFDIAGVARTSADMHWLQQLLPITPEQLAGCYTPYWWDSIAPWGKCGFIAGTVMNREFKAIGSDRDIYPASEKLTGLWLNSIAHHPLAYMEHRLKHFNAELNFLVPALVRRFGINDWTQWEPLKNDPDKLAEVKRREIRQDYWRKNFLFWPATWLALSIALLVGLRNEAAGTTQSLRAARLLVASGFGYAMAYLFIGVASEMRYMYWMILSSFIALILGWREIEAQIRRGDRPTIACAAAIPAVVVGGLVFRIFDIQWFVL